MATRLNNKTTTKTKASTSTSKTNTDGKSVKTTKGSNTATSKTAKPTAAARNKAVREKAVKATETVVAKTVKAAEAAKAIAVETIEAVPHNITKESLEKNFNDIKEVASTVPKATAQKVKEFSATAKNTLTKTSEDLVKTVKKNIPKTKTVEKTFFIQYFGKEVSENTLIERFNSEWTKSHNLADIKSLKVYYKVEENTAYYLVNNEISLSIKFF